MQFQRERACDFRGYAISEVRVYNISEIIQVAILCKFRTYKFFFKFTWILKNQ